MLSGQIILQRLQGLRMAQKKTHPHECTVCFVIFSSKSLKHRYTGTDGVCPQAAAPLPQPGQPRGSQFTPVRAPASSAKASLHTSHLTAVRAAWF